MITREDVMRLFEYEENPQAFNGPKPRQVPDAVRNYYEREKTRKAGRKVDGKAAQDKCASAELFLYDIIGEDFFGGISSKQFADELRALGDVTEISLRINSDGGAVSDGMAMKSLLDQHSAEITVSIDGMAASIASVIAMAGDTIQMSASSMMMIHNAWMATAGDAAYLRSQADILEKVSSQIVDVYHDRTGVSKGKVAEMMAAETWMTGQEAVDAGFADKLVAGKTTNELLRERIDFARNQMRSSHAA